MMRYAETSKDDWSDRGSRPDPDLYATRLKCGYEAVDEYNWHAV